MTQIVKHEDFNLQPEKAISIEQSFFPKIEEKKGYEKVYAEIINAEISEDLVGKASELRKKLVKVRTGVAKIHKVEKQYFLQAGKFVDAIKNKLTEPVVQMEEKLSEIENYYENLEKERLDKLQQKRVSELEPYLEDAAERNLSAMEEDVWQAYLSAKKTAWEDEQAAIKKAEEDRLEQERIEREKTELSHSRQVLLRPYFNFLYEDLDLREMSEDEFQSKLKELKSEKEAYDFEQERIREENEKLKQQQEEERSKQAKIDAENKAKLEAEQKAKDELAAKLKAKEQQEKDRLAEEEKARQLELSKGDIEKVADLKADLLELKTKYSFKSKKNQKMYSDVNALIDKVVAHIEK